MPRSAPDWADLTASAAELERWLLPAECLSCRGSVPTTDGDALVCSLCRSRWVRLPPPICGRCGQPGDAESECRICPEWPPELAGVESAVWLEPGARRAVHLLKYEGWWRVAAAMATVMGGLGPLHPPALLVPIPLGAARLRSRGYNQSAVLATEVGRRSGLPVASELLSRIRETSTQTALTPEEREANLRGAFRAASRCEGRVVLVDDVFTTGATIVSAARSVLAAGARAVSAVTFARAERPLAAASAALGSNARRRS